MSPKSPNTAAEDLMYVLPLESIFRHLAISPTALETEQRVELPATFLKMLLQLAIAHCDFDEDDYLDKNPDVRIAVTRGAIESGFVHYVGFGYFEGRRGGIPQVDEEWYANKYPDIAAAVAAGTIKSATDHFYRVGAAEGPSPNLDHEAEAAQWKMALGG
jgi:hypothetical protein